MLYKDHLATTMEDDDDDARVMYHKGCALRAHLMFLVDTLIFMDKIATHVDDIYLR